MIRLTAVIELDGQGPRALTHESNQRTIIIGRDPDADFQVPLTTVSRQHLRINETDGVYVVEDLGSTHGTLLNGKKLGKGERKVLRDADVLELTKARITCNIEVDKVADVEPEEGTQAIASKAVAGLLDRLGEAQGEGPFIRMLTGPDADERYPLSSGSEWAMGRSKDCEIVLNDANVSRRHGLVKKDWNGYTVTDLGSKNGVIVNGKKIGKPKRLNNQDEIAIGPIKLLFIDPDADLMQALAGVPGFEQPEEEPDEMEADPSVMGAPEDEDPDPGPEGEQEPGFDGESEDGDPQQHGDDEDEEDFSDIDPELLADVPKRGAGEFIIIGVVGLLILASLGALVFIFV